MSTVNLDNRIKLEIIALRGDTFGPLQFIFTVGEDEDTTEIENLYGAIFEGELEKGKTIIHRFTEDELSFDETTSSLTLSLDSSLTQKLGNSVLKFQIRQILEDVTTTRISGSLTFLDNV